MSDEQITDEQVVAQAVAPFVETVGDAVEAATAVLEALREAGFDVYRPEGCPHDKVVLVDGVGRVLRVIDQTADGSMGHE